MKGSYFSEIDYTEGVFFFGEEDFFGVFGAGGVLDFFTGAFFGLVGAFSIKGISFVQTVELLPMICRSDTYTIPRMDSTRRNTTIPNTSVSQYIPFSSIKSAR